MARKKLSTDELRSRLTLGYFGESRELPPSDPITVTQMVLEIDRIRPYDGNPRRQRNPQYEEIKASIREQKRLNNAIEVTRRPDDEFYMVRAGGNTRLQILKELYEETGDEAYRRVHVLFHPWTSDQEVLGAHLIENEMRGSMTLIDRALAVERLREMFEAETGEGLNRSDLQRRLQGIGYTASRTLLRRFEYAARTLLPCIPQALHGGLGNDGVEKLRKLHRATHALGESHGHPRDAVDALFEEALESTDAADWDPDAARQVLERRLGSELGLELRTVRMELDTPAAGPGDADDPGHIAPDPAPSTSAPAASTTPVSPTSTPSGEAPAGTEPAPGATGSPDIAIPSGQDSPEGGPPHATGGESEPVTPRWDPGDAPTVDGLRRRIFDLADRLTKRHHLAGHLRAVDFGYGYALNLPPEEDRPLTQQKLTDDECSDREWVWWLLVSWSHIGLHPDRVLRDVPSHRLANAMVDGREDAEIRQRFDEPNWRGIGVTFSLDLSDEDFDAITALIRSCRQLTRLAEDHGIDLWEG